MMKVKFSTTKHLEHCILDDEPTPVEGEGEVYGALASEDGDPLFVVWDGEEFRLVRCSECTPL